jgi:Uma2 family endonuclease
MEAVRELSVATAEKEVPVAIGEQEIPAETDEWALASPPDISHLITEDDTPVDNLFSAKQQRLLVEPLYSGWENPEPFLADANVGVFASVYEPPLIPDMFLSLGVQAPKEDVWKKEHRSYFLWMYGKPPDAVVEVVSNRAGGEGKRKVSAYARMGIPYYAIYDPQRTIQEQPLIIYELLAGRYMERPDNRLPEIGLSLQLWDSEYEGMAAVWLRWATFDGVLIPTGAELADEQRQVAEEQRQLAEEQRERAEKLAARLRELGIDPATVL